MLPTIYIINASAGHGKDYTKDLLEEILKINTIKLHFAQKAKEIIAEGIFSEKNISLEEKVNKLNDYKDNKLDTNVIGESNMRKTLQVLLGDVIRTINPEIHALFVLKKVEENLIKEENKTFICTDNRYKNEQELLYPINLLKTKENKIDYIRWQIKDKKTKLNEIEILETFENLTKGLIKTNKDKNMLNKIKILFLKENNKLKSSEFPKKDYKNFIENINFEEIGNLTKEEGLKRGLINIFRPLIKENIEINEKELENEIKKYNNIEQKEIENIKFNYETFNIKFNIENVKKYGFLRANPNHISERDLDGRKPEPFINIPNNESLNLKFLLEENLKSKKNINNNIKIKRPKC